MNITLNKVLKKYGDKIVLNIDKLELKEEVITGIIGPNGSGKSTLMRIIAGLDNDFTGSLYINEGEVNQEIFKSMTMVFQKPYLINTDVYNNIAYPLKVRGESKAEIDIKLKKVIELLKLEYIVHQNARTLSGGEMQKVALARAIVFEPRLLLLDEPTANIDPQTMLLMENAINYINQSCKTTVILVTHNIGQLQRMCKQAVFMREGSVEKQGEVREVLSNIKGTYIDEFLEPEM
jgi:tungstate transport system ATP-binding protein